MPIGLYIDEQVNSSIAKGLWIRRVDVLTVQADGFDGMAEICS